jgi:single-stranded-DNA-specific exonuclease
VRIETLEPRLEVEEPPTQAAPQAPETMFGVVRSALGRPWRPRLDTAARALALAIAQRHGLPEVAARVLAGRGVGLDAVAEFLAPSLKSLMPDPSSLVDMDAAAERLAEAVSSGEEIAVIADYDVDGATSAAILSRYIGAVARPPRVHIPDRLTEGYGPSVEAVEGLAAGGARLLVTLDCGTSSGPALERARALGLSAIVVDHHPAGEALPPALAIVNPNRQDDLSGLGNLAAAGVTFMLVVALNRALRRRGLFRGRREPDLFALLDLVALGTVCDVVPLTGLNRAFVARGLSVMHRRGNAGLAALADAARLRGPAAAYHLGFLLGPRINAGGRIGDSALGCRLLTLDDPAEARAIAERLDVLNRERQEIEAVALAEAEAMTLGAEAAVTVVAGDWHPGVVGLVAARLVERTGRPAVALARGGAGIATGSCRSVPGIDLGAAIHAAVAEGLLVKGGGHAMAAGLTIAVDRIGALEAFLNERLAGSVAAVRAGSGLTIDAPMTAGGASVELVELLEKVGPFGAGHPEPVFAFPAHRVVEAVGVGKAHVKAVIAAGDGRRLEAIAYRAADRPHGRALIAGRGATMHLAGTLGVDSWGGSHKVVLRILDVADPLGSRENV